MHDFIAIIPARFASIRLPGKPLKKINGKPMIVHVMENAKASGAKQVIVATDHIDVIKEVKKAGGIACLTKSNHKSGSERIEEVINKYKIDDDQIIVNIQGDEPLIFPKTIKHAVDSYVKTKANMTTLAVPFSLTEEIFNPNIIKVVTDINGYALYFSRASIPWNHLDFKNHYDQPLCKGMLRHIGIYVYRSKFLHRYVNWPISPIETLEILEQLRVLWHGEKIHVTIVDLFPVISVDTPEDLKQVRLLLAK